MPYVAGLRSPYARVGPIVYFGRMLDKIRLHAAGKLPMEYQANLGETSPNLFDARCCRFLGLSYVNLAQRTRDGGSDMEILSWAKQAGRSATDDECNTWNRFMMKIGWRDERSAFLQQRIAELGLNGHAIDTFFDLLDFDEGRDPVRSRAWELRPAMILVVMGVAGSGKTTTGARLANTLKWRFNDADEFHPSANLKKMSSGLPLTDEDRWPWLRAIRAHIDQCLSQEENAVVTCSALKQSYRDLIISDPSRVKLVYLKGSRELLSERITERQSHFMKPQMLDSQLATLEEPKSNALVVDIASSPETIVAEIVRVFGL